jgi:uncharacterized protein
MSMLLDLHQFRGAVDHIDRRFEPEVFQGTDEDFKVVAPVGFQAEVRKDGQKVRLVGRLATTLEVGCSRCLEPFAIPVDTAFDLLFLPSTANAGEPEQQIDDEDVGVSFYRDDVIDLGEVMREQFYLALPMKPLCREDCQGLCPVCGVNRNRESCSCQAEWVDPRMDALRKFKSGQGSSQ